jgi:hypothetical protein
MAKIIPNQNTWIGFVTTFAAAATTLIPTEAEIADATDVTPFVISLNAASQGNVIPTPSLDSLFETSIPGTSQASFSGDFYRDDTQVAGVYTDVAWNLWERGDKGYFIVSRYGGSGAGAIPEATDTVEVWPVFIVSKTMANMANNTVETFTLTCSVPVEPNENVTVAA